MVNDRHQELFDYLHNELNAIALQTQMFEIERIVLKIQDKSIYCNQERFSGLAKWLNRVLNRITKLSI
jgi:hypothetical protein